MKKWEELQGWPAVDAWCAQHHMRSSRSIRCGLALSNKRHVSGVWGRGCDGCGQKEFGCNWDHPLLVYPDGASQSKILILQPYHVDVNPLRTWCAIHNAMFDVRPQSESFHYKDHSHLIYIWSPKQWGDSTPLRYVEGRF